jgi:peptidoglycan L-alanyl-D-glutamate endopeptidase CwlK
MYRLSNRSYRRLEGVNPLLVEILTEAIKDSPFDFGIPLYGGFRTAAEQNKLYQKGRSQLGNKVTNLDGYNRKSYHQSGNAFDIYVIANGDVTWNAEFYKPVARHIKSIAKNCFNVELTWGGDWVNFKDYPHFQID